jgi:hypothetical protein
MRSRLCLHQNHELRRSMPNESLPETENNSCFDWPLRERRCDQGAVCTKPMSSELLMCHAWRPRGCANIPRFDLKYRTLIITGPAPPPQQARQYEQKTSRSQKHSMAANNSNALLQGFFTVNVFTQDLVFTSSELRKRLALQQGCGPVRRWNSPGGHSAPACSLCPTSPVNAANPLAFSPSLIRSPW